MVPPSSWIVRRTTWPTWKCRIRTLFRGDFLAPELLFRLGRAKQVRRQLGRPHVVEDVLAALELLALVDILCAQSTVQAHIPMVVKDREILRRQYACQP